MQAAALALSFAYGHDPPMSNHTCNAGTKDVFICVLVVLTNFWYFLCYFVVCILLNFVIDLCPAEVLILCVYSILALVSLPGRALPFERSINS